MPWPVRGAMPSPAQKAPALASRHNPTEKLPPHPLRTMSSTTDHAFIATQTAALLRPLVASTSSIPTPLLSAVNASLSRDLKLKLAPSAVRQAIDQLGELRGRKWRAGEKRRERERSGRVVVRKGGEGWVEDLGKVREWPVAEGEEETGEEER